MTLSFSYGSRWGLALTAHGAIGGMLLGILGCADRKPHPLDSRSEFTTNENMLSMSNRENQAPRFESILRDARTATGLGKAVSIVAQYDQSWHEGPLYRFELSQVGADIFLTEVSDAGEPEFVARFDHNFVLIMDSTSHAAHRIPCEQFMDNPTGRMQSSAVVQRLLVFAGAHLIQQILGKEAEATLSQHDARQVASLMFDRESPVREVADNEMRLVRLSGEWRSDERLEVWWRRSRLAQIQVADLNDLQVPSLKGTIGVMEHLPAQIPRPRLSRLLVRIGKLTGLPVEKLEVGTDQRPAIGGEKRLNPQSTIVESEIARYEARPGAIGIYVGNAGIGPPGPDSSATRHGEVTTFEHRYSDSSASGAQVQVDGQDWTVGFTLTTDENVQREYKRIVNAIQKCVDEWILAPE